VGIFDQKYEEWLQKQINEETNPRRRQLLNKGLGHGTVEFLRSIWYPAIGHLDHLYPEWEVRDLGGNLRYLDLGYLPGDARGCIEVHGYRSHARDVDVTRFKDLCMKQAMLALDDWLFLPIAYLSIQEDPERCRQLILSFVGKFLSTHAPSDLDWAEAEALRFSRRLLRPFTPPELASHLRLSDRHTRRVLHDLVTRGLLVVRNGNLRYRTYQIRMMDGSF
jgi:hypothetical protein